MQSTIKTSGELRSFLLNCMEEVANGKLKVERAAVVVKAASQVNESIYAELKAKQLHRAIGETVHDFGEMPMDQLKS